MITVSCDRCAKTITRPINPDQYHGLVEACLVKQGITLSLPCRMEQGLIFSEKHFCEACIDALIAFCGFRTPSIMEAFCLKRS